LGFPNWSCETSTNFLALLPERKRISARGVSHFQSFYFVIVLLSLFTLFLFASLYQKYKKISSFYSFLFLFIYFSLARMSTPENTKLCDFTSTNNSDFICTPIAPPAPEANFYEIKKSNFLVLVVMMLLLISTILLSYVRCKSKRM
jgi:hypothetical protein